MEHGFKSHMLGPTNCNTIYVQLCLYLPELSRLISLPSPHARRRENAHSPVPRCLRRPWLGVSAAVLGRLWDYCSSWYGAYWTNYSHLLWLKHTGFAVANSKPLGVPWLMTPVMNRIAGILLMPTSLSPERLVNRRHYGKFLGTCQKNSLSLGCSNLVCMMNQFSREWSVYITCPIRACKTYP